MSTRLKMIQRFSTERELRDKLLEPLFERMGFEVFKTHGVNEFGKDFILAKSDEIGVRRLTSVVVKKGNIGVGSSEKDRTSIETISRQVRQSFEIAYPDPVTKEQKKVHRVFFVCDGSISDNAKRVITEQWGSSKELYEQNTEFIPGEKLAQITSQHWSLFFSSKEPELTEYSEQLLKKIEGEEKARSINIDSKISSICDRYLQCTLYEVSIDINGRIKYVAKEPDNIFNSVSKILIVGESGSGKSYLLREQLRKIVLREEETPRLKIYCRLAELSEIENSIEKIQDFCIKQIAKVSDKISSQYLLPFFIDKKIDFYLDGFDEIGTEEMRLNAIGNINVLLSFFPKSQIVVTTRELDIALKQGLPHVFQRYNIKQLSYKESVHYLQTIIKEASTSCDEIMKEIKHQGLMLSLPRTPLTLQLIGSLFFENASKEIPSNTTEVYKMYSEIMLGRWDRERDVTNTFDYERKVSLLGEIGLYMQENVSEEILFERASEITENFLSSMGDDSSKAARLLDEIIKRSEILTISNGEYIKFKHRSFQEFFAAYKVHTHGKDYQKMAQKIHDPWWVLRPSNPSPILGMPFPPKRYQF
jgi:predicted NACHT family NTPase